MGLPKIIWEKDQLSPRHKEKEKEEVVEMIKKIQLLILKDPEKKKKASKVIENWINQSKL